MSIRKHLKSLAHMVKEFTPDHKIEFTSGDHIRITLRHNGMSRTVFAPLTPSDHRSMLNVRTKVRHAFKSMVAA